jgi:hypothetical protein
VAVLRDEERWLKTGWEAGYVRIRAKIILFFKKSKYGLKITASAFKSLTDILSAC